ncbi:hypothetical protein BCR34DRAFT_444014, partial [Clohesyomyces aquaticus]
TPTPSAGDSKISLAASSTVYTYHCLCSHLLLATTTPLPSLPQRQHCISKAYIMPLPPPPSPQQKPGSRPHAHRHSPSGQGLQDDSHYGLLISTFLQREPEIVTSESGFEKRYLQRCGRCNLIVGYQLDWAQFPDQMGEGTNAGMDVKLGRREDVVFLLPGALMTTRDMVLG